MSDNTSVVYVNNQTTSVEVSQSPDVVVIETVTNPIEITVANLQGPQGAQGTPGVTGPTGPTGATGLGLLPVTPASASATGTQGTVVWDSGYIYVCVATNTWKRAAITTW